MRRWALAVCVLVAACAGNALIADTELSNRGIERSGKPNDYLICPADICDAADLAAPVLAVPASALFDDWLEVIDTAPRTTVVSAARETGKIHAEQRSAVFGFVDSIRIETIELAQGSTFIAYSRSETGYYDFGVNRRRLEDWLAQIEQIAGRPD